MVVPRWVQLVLLPIALLAAWALARASGRVLLLFVVAGVIALILNPVVAFLQRSGLPRGLAVLSVFLAFFLTLAGIGFLLANPISNQVRTFTHNLPHIVNEANARSPSAALPSSSTASMSPGEQGKTALQTLSDKISKSSSGCLLWGWAATGSGERGLQPHPGVRAVGLYAALRRTHRALVRRAMPESDGTPGGDYPTLIQHAVSRYVGGQLLFSVIMGTTAGLALYLFGVRGSFPMGATRWCSRCSSA